MNSCKVKINNLIRNSVRTYKHIIWDWNGTLLDDVDVVIDAMNNLY